MALTVKIDGDPVGGWQSEIHDGGALHTSSPEGATMWHALKNAVMTHLHLHGHAPDEPAPMVAAASEPVVQASPAAANDKTADKASSPNK